MLYAICLVLSIRLDLRPIPKPRFVKDPCTLCGWPRSCLLISNEREGNVLFNYALDTFYLRLYGVRHMVKDHSDSEKVDPLPPHRLLFPINNKGSFISIIPQTG